ncbi:MAG: tetratricopeptide repeat protein [Pseudomonadota bacterium]
MITTMRHYYPIMIPSRSADRLARRPRRPRSLLLPWRWALACLAFTIAVTSGGGFLPSAVALAQVEDTAAVEAVTRLNKRALEEYDNLNFDRAQKTLTEALDLCGQKGLDKHPIKARTLIHLGVVILAGGDAQRAEAVKQFQMALAIQPDITPTSRVANPEVQSAFDEAAKAAKVEGGSSTAVTPPDAPPAADTAPVEPPVATEGVSHDAIASAVTNSVLPVSVTTDPSLRARKVTLAFRADGASEFVTRELKEYSAGNWSGSIPASATGGEHVLYAITVMNEAGEVVGSYGSETAPQIVILKARSAAPKRMSENEEPEDEPERATPVENPTWLLGLGVGSGFGYASGYGDVNNQDKVQAAFGAAKLGHVLPEVGYFVSSDMVLSLQMRFQAVSGATSLRDVSNTMCGSDHVCDPVPTALAAFAKVTLLFSERPFLPYLSLSVGAGQIRHLASFPAPNNVNCGAKGGLKCVDTVTAGPILLGPGAGFILNVTPNFGFTLGANALLGFSVFTFHVDLNAGLVVLL